MADDRKPRKDPTAIDDGKLKLYAKPLKDDGVARSPSLRVKMIENNPCIHVDLGIKTEGKGGRDGYPISIETPMEPRSFMLLMNLIEDVASYKGVCSFVMENWGHPFIWDRDAGKNVRSKERLVVSKFCISKREDGMVTFGVTAKGKQDVEFEFTPNEFHVIIPNGGIADVSLSSKLAAKAWATVWKEVFPQHFERNWAEPEFQKRRRLENMQRANGGGGGGGNNYNRQNNNGGGGQQQQQRPAQTQQPVSQASGFDDDDDIPF